MEHRLIRGGEQYLPFARSRIKALLAAGLVYSSQKFIFSDGTVRVRIMPGHEYIDIEGDPGGPIWVLVTLSEFGKENDPGISSGAAEVRVFSKRSRLVRIKNFDAKKSKAVHAGGGTATLITSRTGRSVWDGVNMAIPVFKTQYYASHGELSGLNSLLGAIESFAPYGNKLTTFHDVTPYNASEINATENQTYYYTLSPPEPPLGTVYSLIHDDVFRSVSSRTSKQMTRIKSGGVTVDHNFTTVNYSTFTNTRGSQSTVTSASVTGDYAYPPATFPDVCYSTSAAQSFKLSAGSFVLTTDPSVSTFNVDPFWTWRDGPAVAYTAPGDPEWDVVLGSVARNRRRREVSWHKQGHNFIQYPNGDVYNRANSIASKKEIYLPNRTFAFSYTQFITMGYLGAAYRLQYVEQLGPYGYMASTIKELDIRQLPGIKDDPEMISALEAARMGIYGTIAAFGSTHDTANNRVKMQYFSDALTIKYVTVQVMFDQKSLFDETAEWI